MDIDVSGPSSVGASLTDTVTDSEQRPPTAGNLAPVAELVQVSKTFGSTVAAEDVSFVLYAGEVLALVGENGAGKSTCVKVLGGVYRPDGGEVRVDGIAVNMHSPLDAQRHGIAVVHQHPGLFGELSIAENIFAGKPLRNRAGFLDHGRMRREARLWLSKLGLRRDPSVLVSSLRTSEQQMVEIARALAAQAKVLVLDEPTAALATAEVESLFAVVRELRADGVALLFVGHRLEEIFAISDRITVLRDGRLVGTRATAEITPGDAVRLMVGRPLSDLYPKSEAALGDVVLRTEELASDAGISGITMQVRAGEIVGVAGLVGSGRTELARVLFGIDKQTAGVVRLDGAAIRVRSASDALARGIAYVSEDRLGQSLIADFSILDNATLPVVARATRLSLVRRRLEMALVSGPLERMRLKFRAYDQPVGTLSGGNQQKVVIAKWLATNPRLLILDEPTQGVDVQAKAEVHRIASGLAAQGLAVLMISSDMPELLGMSDRILVMRRGRLVAEFDRESATEEAIALAATGAVTADVDATPTQAPPAQTPATQAPPAQAPAAAPTRAPRSTGGWLRVMGTRRETGLIAVLIAMIIPISVINPRFVSGANLSSVSTEAALVGVVALGQMFVVLTRNIDLSVGSVIGLSAFLFGSFVEQHPQMPIIVATLIAVGIGLACGLINGAIVSFGLVPSIVVTLGTLYVFRGIDSIISNGEEIAPGSIPQSVLDLVSRKFLGMSTLVWLCIALFVVGGAALRWTARGREIHQVGSNPDGARLIGVPVNLRVLAAFAISGSLAGLDGALWAAHYGIVDAQSAYGIELTVVAAVVVGGVALRGGYGTTFGVALGTIALFTIQNVLVLARVNSNNLQAFFGAAIILAVGIDMLLARRRHHHKVVM